MAVSQERWKNETDDFSTTQHDEACKGENGLPVFVLRENRWTVLGGLEAFKHTQKR